MLNTGENDQAMRKILNMTKLISIIILALHFYVVCHKAFTTWHLVSGLTNRVLNNVFRTDLFSSFHRPKLIALGFLLFLSGGTMVSQIIRDKLSNDIFSRKNETFPQKERLLKK